MYQHRRTFVAIAAVCSFAIASATISAYGQQSGQRNFANVSIEPAIDYTTGGTVYLLTPVKAPLPSKSNPVASAPLYLVAYPTSSTVPAADLNCQPDNCDHINVLPFPSPDYGALDGSDQACTDFNGGSPCSLVEGHDHLVGIASTKGDFNVAWAVKLVFFTHPAFVDGKINQRITTLSQLTALWKSGEVMVVDTPITFNCSGISARTYQLGTPVAIQFP